MKALKAHWRPDYYIVQLITDSYQYTYTEKIGSTRSVMESTADGRCRSTSVSNSKTIICLTCLYDDHYIVGPSLQTTSPKVGRYGRKKLMAT